MNRHGHWGFVLTLLFTTVSLAELFPEIQRELAQEQTKAANRNWQLAFPGTQPQTRVTDHFLIMSSSPSELQDVADVAETLCERIPKILKLRSSTGSSLTSWGTIYVLPKRYDYGEFGRMAENRQLPVEMHGHWRSQDSTAYIVLGPPEEDGLPLDTRLGQYLASVLVDGWGGVPAWFADGVGHVVAERLSRRHPQIRGWRSRATRLVPALTSEKALLASDLPLESAGIVNWAFTRYLMQDNRRSSLLLRALQEGSPFEDAFVAAYGARSETVCQRWLVRNGGGKKKP